jgi:hypothetical protein
MYNVPVFMIIFRTDNPFRIVIIPSLLSFCACFVAFLPIITLPANPLDDCCCLVVTPPTVALPTMCVSTPFNNSAVPALLRVCALLVIPNALRFVGDRDDDVNSDPGDGVLRRLDDVNADVCFNDGFNGFEDFFFGNDFVNVGCMTVVFDTENEEDVIVLSSALDVVNATATGGLGGSDWVVVAVVVSTVLLSLLLLLLLLLLQLT